jgi:hypothetical protein
VESQVEIYRIAPGQQEAFLKFIALCDGANRQAGLPPRQLFVHEDGADWDFLLIQPLHDTDHQNKAWSAAATAWAFLAVAISSWRSVSSSQCTPTRL